MRDKDKQMFANLRETLERHAPFYYIHSEMLVGWETQRLREILSELNKLADEAMSEIDGIYKIHGIKIPE